MQDEPRGDVNGYESCEKSYRKHAMPVTPWHLGPGAAFKSLAPERISFTVFVFTQGIMDAEPLYWMLQGEYPLHRAFHTLAGAAFLTLLGATMGRWACIWTLRFWNGRYGTLLQGRLRTQPVIPWPSAFWGALLGAFSHLGLDAFMHADLHPLAPFSDDNPLLHRLDIGTLHEFCLGVGLVGVILLIGRNISRAHAGSGTQKPKK
jgi:hypothetical protein